MTFRWMKYHAIGSATDEMYTCRRWNIFYVEILQVTSDSKITVLSERGQYAVLLGGHNIMTSGPDVIMT